MREITAKTLLNNVRQPDDWFGLRYNMNLYRGCQHQCIYCDSRSECYQIEDFNEILVKANALELLRKEITRKRIKGTIGTGSMNDPYMPIETKQMLTRGALEIIAEFRFPVHVITKSDLVLRDLDLLERINQIFAAVSFTITTTDDTLSKKLEPGAPPSSRRFTAMKRLAEHSIHTGVLMMPILPELEDSDENITAIVEQAHTNGAEYILPSFGLTMRDRQRAHLYDKFDRLFPGLSEKYQRRYGNRYYAASPRSRELDRLFHDMCEKYGIATHMPVYQPDSAQQLRLFG